MYQCVNTVWARFEQLNVGPCVDGVATTLGSFKRLHGLECLLWYLDSGSGAFAYGWHRWRHCKKKKRKQPRVRWCRQGMAQAWLDGVVVLGPLWYQWTSMYIHQMTTLSDHRQSQLMKRILSAWAILPGVVQGVFCFFFLGDILYRLEMTSRSISVQ